MGMLLGVYIFSFFVALVIILLRNFFKGSPKEGVEGTTGSSDTSQKEKKLTKTEIQSTSNYSRTKAMSLCLLGFIGFAGLHRFYVGRWVSGSVFLVTFGCFFLGTLVDIVYLYCESFEDQHGCCLDCAARKRSNIKRAKWLYIHWNLRGRYYIDKTSVRRENKSGISTLSCAYLGLINDWGRKNIFNDRSGDGKVECIVSLLDYQINNGILFVIGTRVQLLDKYGRIIKDEMVDMPWEKVYKNSIYECVHQKAREIEKNVA